MKIAVNGHQITIYEIYNLKIKTKNNHNITRSTKPAFYITNITHYNIILGLVWLDYVNPDIYWSERKWFYRDSIIFIEEFSKEDFEKFLEKKTIIYTFYESPINLE
jgi:hypothetical protein